MRTQTEIEELVADLETQEKSLTAKLDELSNGSSTLIKPEDTEQREKVFKAMNKTLSHIRIQLHSFRWVLANKNRA